MSDVTRYSMTEIFDNFEPLYDSYFRERGVKYIKQYEEQLQNSGSRKRTAKKKAGK